MITFVLTIIGGTLVFVLGQFTLKLVIEPAQELKKAIGSVSNTLLVNQAQLTNAAFNKEIAERVKLHSADILSKSFVVLGYKVVQKCFGLPSKVNIVLASQELNLLSYGMREESRAFGDSLDNDAKKTNFGFENWKTIKKVGNLLEIQTTYQDE